MSKSKELECSYCSLELVPPRLGMVMGAPSDEMFLKTGYYCVDCNKIACSQCSFRAAKLAGKSHFVCPACGANIHESLAT